MTKLDYFEERHQYYQMTKQRYKEILKELGSKPNSKLSVLVKSIDELFIKNVYSAAMGIYQEYEILKKQFEGDRNFAEYAKNLGGLRTRMAALEGSSEEKFENWINELEKETKSAGKENVHTESVLKKVNELIKPLSIKDYYQKSHAIIIGINNYENNNPLTNAINDAKAVRDTLQNKYGFENIIQLYDEEATAPNIRRIFDGELLNRKLIGREDRVLIYFAGHGKKREIPLASGENVIQGFILPVEALRGRPDTYIKMDELVANIKLCAARHILLVLDCCYSGIAALRDAGETEAKADRTTEEFLEYITGKKAIQVIAAGGDEQPVTDSGVVPGHSAFTGAFLELLDSDKDMDEDGVLTASEIGNAIRSTVKVHLGSQSKSQTTVYNHIQGSQMGDFVFKILPIEKKD